jgi:hypothetical protein
MYPQVGWPGSSSTIGKLKLDSGIVNTSSPVLDLSQTWNNSGVTFTGLKLNATDTASGGSSLISDFQVNNIGVFGVAKNGNITVGSRADNGSNLVITPTSITTARGTSAGYPQLDISVPTNTNGLGLNGRLRVTSAAVIAQQPFYIGISNSYGTEVALYADAANTLAQRVGTNPQTFRVYNTYSDDSNYGRGFLRWNSNVFEIGMEKAGTGTGSAVKLFSTSSQQWVSTETTLRSCLVLGSTSPSLICGAGARVNFGSGSSASISTQNSPNGAVEFGPEARTSTTRTHIMRPSAKDAYGGYTGDGHSMSIMAGKGAAGNNNGGALYLDGGEATGSGTAGDVILGNTRGNLQIADARNLLFGSSTGSKIGTATSQKLAFWNATPIVQPTTGISSATFTENSGTTVNSASTFDGYTLAQVVKALRDTGLLA